MKRILDILVISAVLGVLTALGFELKKVETQLEVCQETVNSYENKFWIEVDNSPNLWYHGP